MNTADALVMMSGAIVGGSIEKLRGNDPVHGIAVGASTAYAMKDAFRETNTRNMLNHAITVTSRLLPFAVPAMTLSRATAVSTGFTYAQTQLQEDARRQGARPTDQVPPRPLAPYLRRRRNL